MNDIQNLIDRQLGLYCQLNYDNVLKRLVVDSEESFYGLQSANVVASFDQDPPIFACRFSEAPGYEHILALANEDGKVAIQNTTNKRTASTLDSFQCHNNAVFDLAWMPGHMSFVTVSGDHTACLWDVAEGAPRRVLVFSNHTRSVKTAVFRPNEGSVFASGARDGHILVWDVRASPQPALQLQLKPDNCLYSCHARFTPKTPGSHSKRPRIDSARAVSVTGLAFRDHHTLLSCGECDGNIKVWDLRKSYNLYTREPLPKHSIPYCGSSTRNGYTNLVVDDARVRLYASCMDNVIYCFNVATYSALPERRYVGHENGTFYIKTGLSPDCAYLVSGSSDRSAYIWNVRRSQPLVRLAGHWAEVTCAAWSRDARHTLVTCSDDARHKIWRIGPEPAEAAALQADPALQPRGRAEPVPRADLAQPQWAARDHTPSSLKRPNTTTTPSAKRARPDPAARTSKRCLADLMTAAAAAEPAGKRPRPPDDEVRLLPAGIKRPRDLADPARDPADPARDPADPDPASAEWGYVPAAGGGGFVTPTKSYGSPGRGAGSRRSPKSPSPAKVRIISFGTPTKNLPDYVLTGEAPHLRLMSPVKKKQDTTNWLTLIVRERRGRPAEGGEGPPAAAPLSPKENVPSRRNSVADRGSRPTKKNRTLLKYFSVADRGK